jgi:HD-GYP domain-containing protein (c-di-GMP phosphodiesterase class II)
MAEQNDSRGEARQSYFAKQQLIDSARQAFQLLTAVLKNAALYPASHPIMLTGADKLRHKISELLIGRKEAAFYLVGGELFFEKISVPIDQGLALVMEHLTARDVGGIVFKPGMTSAEIITFSALMGKEPGFFTGPDGPNGAIRREGIVHMELHRVLLVDKGMGGAVRVGKRKASEIFKETVDTMKDIVQSVEGGRTASARKMNTVVQSMVDNVLDNRDAFLGLTNLKMYDEYTFAHSVNVAILAVSLGTYLSFTKPQVAALGVAGLMHDIGKVNVPHEIINKPGKLTDEEWELVKRHPVEGAFLLAHTPGVSKLAMVAAFEHHQHGGERGYPRVDGELHQHPFSQIISLSDAYEAITAARVYYNIHTPPDEGVRILLKKRGAPFNIVLVNAFVKMMGLFPVGSVLKLDTGEVGLVMHQTSDLMRPRVLILTVFDGSEKGNPPVSLLETMKGRYKRSVVGTINPSAAKLDIKKYSE